MSMSRGMALVAATVAMAVAFAATAAETVTVSIDKYRFLPAKVTIKPGTRVEWRNDEKRTSHSILFESEGLPESDRLFPGDTWGRSFDKPGIYDYRCGPHPEMKGVVEVVP